MKINYYKSLTREIEEREITPLFICNHVKDDRYYSSIENVQFDKESEIILVKEDNACYGFSVLWLRDRKNKIYEWDGFGHSGAASVVCALLQKNIKEEKKLTKQHEKISDQKQEIERLKKENKKLKQFLKVT